MPGWDRLLLNATSINAEGQQLKNQAIAISQGLIQWCGPCNDLPANDIQNSKIIEDCHGELITPGLIDCHTHLVYASDRLDEFRMRNQGLGYNEIARMGKGILTTVKQTRGASEEELILQALPRIFALRDDGVTTVEIKSGYGLDLQNELKMLRVARRLGQLSGLRVKTTFLGAHALPPEFKQKATDYVDFLCNEVLPEIAATGLADAVDVFCETIGFDLEQTEKIFKKSKALSLNIKCHAEQLSRYGASQLATSYDALSCDHLEHIEQADAVAMAKHGTVAVLLPGAYYFLQESKKPPIHLLREAGVKMAVATDLNPGTSPTCSLRLMMSMACQLFSLTIEEALAAVTANAAKALGIDGEVGTIAVGLAADLVHWFVSDSAALCYYFGYPIKHRTMVGGMAMRK